MRNTRFVVLFLACLLPLTGLFAKPISQQQIPDELKPWKDWVLYGEESLACPFIYHDIRQRRCAWPTGLTLDLRPAAGTFSQQWYAYTDSLLTLPGDSKHWPQEVKLNGEDAIVVMQDGRPSVWVGAGAHRLSGRFQWSRVPESLLIPVDTGLINLTVNNRSIPAADVDATGKLWLRERDTGKQDKDGDQLDIQVFRRVNDLIPQQVTTRLLLNVAGAQREVVVGKALLEGFIPLQLISRLPARLEPDGRLRLQVRPGKWTIDLVARATAAITQLNPDKNPAPWPDEEIWSFEAQTSLRLIEIEGAPTVDPRQTNLPADWRNFPAYRLTPTTTMVFKQIRRGDPEPAPDQLSLNRELWLDHDGAGYTVKDTIQGSMTQKWRLEAGPGLQLGRALVDGQPQFITTLPGKALRGVEVRRGAIQLNADSRMHGNIDTLPAVGWQHDFQSVRANLHLPPGWDVLSVRGTDNVPNSWLQRWTLLDLFLVLIIGLAAARMWNWAYGGLALVTVTLLWHEPLAPTYIFLNLLAAIALLRVLPKGVFARIMRSYRSISLIALILIAVPFMVHEIRTGIYPQLEFPGKLRQPYSATVTAPVPEEVASSQIMELSEPRGRKQALFDSYSTVREGLLSSNIPLSKIDPQANIQTGPGLPQWQWRSVPLSWNGPVAQQQQVDVVFINPVANLVLSFLRVILLVVFSAYLFGIDFRKGSGFSFNTRALMPVMLLAVLLPFSISDAQAGLPDENILKELKTRLTAPPDCLPGCAQSPALSLTIADNLMTLQFDIHAQENTAVPLPAHVQQWLPKTISLDGKSPQGLYRNPAGELWVNVDKGLHRIVLSGDMPQRNSFTLPMPLTPHRVDVSAQGWVVDGVHEEGVPDRQLQLTRLQSQQTAVQKDSLEANVLPAFAIISRTLRLGLDWQVETLVQRLSPLGNAIVMEYPLLKGESVISEGVRVENGRVLVSMSPGQAQTHWLSSLEKRDLLKLNAMQTTQWTEIWRADISPIWHVELSGIPVVHHQGQGGQWLPEWHPYPGETASLTISRPLGVTGQTLTIDDSQLTIKPGKRATASTLELNLRSSQGGQHTLTLPESVALQSVSINGVSQPVRQEDRKVTLPLVPGMQQFNLKWRDERPVSLRYRSAAIDLGAASVNHRINLQLGNDRWVLLTGGPRLGPAVLYWGILFVIVLIAIILGRITLTPLRTWQWLLLAVGLSQVSVIVGLIVVGWLLALGARCRLQDNIARSHFNAMQVLLAILSVIALSLLVVAVQQGLLGYPDMMVAGNGSSAYNLNWYQDRAMTVPQSAWVLSVPILVYRLLMLAWALWLAFALLRWLKWGWACYATKGLWRKTPKIINKESSAVNNAATANK
ncbi:hypothetical protein [Sulfuriflexus mobilis]|uniref:hypothetical protein n=1 Tax=Sulfuriflexus mobilis TaxID=1811807 RepID=UPI000F81DD8E|nr:hypothetical protein [Sulfuriflexus mobilis]